MDLEERDGDAAQPPLKKIKSSTGLDPDSGKNKKELPTVLGYRIGSYIPPDRKLTLAEHISIYHAWKGMFARPSRS
jgi:hypothetical protein